MLYGILIKVKQKYQLTIKKKEKLGIKHFNDSKAYIKYSSHVDDIYKKYWKTNSKEKTQSIDCILWSDCWYA